jgi:predicted transcriptional regulator
MRDWKQLKQELLRDPEVSQEYKKLTPKYEVISQLIAVRHQRGLTQEQLAKKAGTAQSAIARLEAGAINPTIDFLERITTALGHQLKIQIA